MRVHVIMSRNRLKNWFLGTLDFKKYILLNRTLPSLKFNNWNSFSKHFTLKNGFGEIYFEVMVHPKARKNAGAKVTINTILTRCMVATKAVSTSKARATKLISARPPGEIANNKAYIGRPNKGETI